MHIHPCMTCEDEPHNYDYFSLRKGFAVFFFFMFIHEKKGRKWFIMAWLCLSPWDGTVTRVKPQRWRLKSFCEWRHKLKVQDGAQTCIQLRNSRLYWSSLLCSNESVKYSESNESWVMSQWVRSKKIKVSVETIKLSITFTYFVYNLHCCLHKAYFWHEISP